MSTSSLLPTLPAHRQAIYNPRRLSDDEVKASYIARQALLEMLLEDIRDTKPRGIPQHHLLVGQRGMGKTTLLRRLEVALQEKPLSDHFIPLGFPEEQWTLDRLSKLWLNCLDSLADTLEKECEGNSVIELIDNLVESLPLEHPKEELLSEHVEKAFLDVAGKLGRRPVLLVDNLDMVFSRLSDHELNRLRAFLMRAGAPILIGACVTPPNTLTDYTAPFHDHFKTHYLDRLSADEMKEVLFRLAANAGDTKLQAHLAMEAPRLAALHALTGGNPRTTVLLFQIFSRGFSEEAYQDLENLLDLMTPLYKARLEELSPQAQVVVSALAAYWEPATAGEIGTVARLENSQVSPLLDRLKKAGIIEEVLVDPDDQEGPLSDRRTTQNRTGYQLAERFFNIWFLMRQATRRDRRNLTFLTRFIECAHTPAERSAMAQELLQKRGLSKAQRIYGLALESAVSETAMRYRLHDHVQQEIVEASLALQEKIEDLIDPAEIPPHRFAFAELKSKLKQAASGLDISPDEFTRAILGSPGLINYRDRLAEQKIDRVEAGQLMNTIGKEVSLIDEFSDKDARTWFCDLLRGGTLVDFTNFEQINEALLRADSPTKIKLCLAYAAPEAKRSVDSKAMDMVQEILSKESNSAQQWVQWALHLANDFKRFEAAEIAYRRALKKDDRYLPAWISLGELMYQVEKYEEAETAFQKGLEIEPLNTRAICYLSAAIANQDGRFLEAEVPLRKAIKVNPRDGHAWGLLALFLSLSTEKDVETEAAFLNSVKLEPNFSRTFRNYGDFLASRNRNSESETAYRKAIELDPNDGNLWALLGKVIAKDKKRRNEAESACRAAMLQSQLQAETWLLIGNLMHFQFDDFIEAEKAYRKAVAIKSNLTLGWTNLGTLLSGPLRRPQEAVEVFEKAIALESNGSLFPAWSLIGVFRDQLGRMEEAKRIFKTLGKGDDLPSQGELLLHFALVAAYQDNWGIATQRLGEALDLIAEHSAFPADSVEGWMRATAVLIHLNYGSNLLDFLQSRGDDQRLRPWFEAIRAHLRGDRRYLRNIPAEMRDVSSLLYGQIEVQLKYLPESTRRWSPPKGKKPSVSRRKP